MSIHGKEHVQGYPSMPRSEAEPLHRLDSATLEEVPWMLLLKA